MLGRALLPLAAIAAAATTWVGGALAATPEPLTIAASDGAHLSCSLVEPDGPPPAAGWPAVILFHGLGGRHEDMEPLATGLLAPDGYVSLECDARGTGASEGLFGLDGPRDVQDTRELFAWLAARPEVSDTQIGAVGFSLGGGAVWNATAAGVPFKAIVPVIAWTDLAKALAPQGLPKSGLVTLLGSGVPESRWDPELLAAKASLLAGGDLATVTALAATRSTFPRLATITTPTLMIQGRRDFLFDADQALSAFARLKGPRRLYLGDLGHAPGISPASAPDLGVFSGEALAWLDHFLKGMPNGIAKKVVELGHDPYNGGTTTYRANRLPPTKTISVLLPGSTTMTGATGKVVRSVRVTGGPHETFGETTVVVPYSHAQSWDHLVAVLAAGTTPISAGGVKTTAASGTVTIRLMNEVVRIAAGQKLTLYLSSTSLAQGPSDALYVAPVQPQAQITIGRVTLRLSVLAQAVSR